MTREELLELRDDPTTPEGMRAQVIHELDVMSKRLTAKFTAEHQSKESAPRPTITPEEMDAGWIAMQADATRIRAAEAAKPKPPIPVPVVEPVIIPRDPEPIARDAGTIWNVSGISYRYLQFDPESKMHLVSMVNPTNFGVPEVYRMSEDRLTNRRYAPPPRTSSCPTPAEVRARHLQIQNRLQRDWNFKMGVSEFGGDPPGC